MLNICLSGMEIKAINSLRELEKLIQDTGKKLSSEHLLLLRNRGVENIPREHVVYKKAG